MTDNLDVEALLAAIDFRLVVQFDVAATVSKTIVAKIKGPVE